MDYLQRITEIAARMLSSAADKHGLHFLVIGGHAVNAYAEPRATLDLDLLILANKRDEWRKVIEAEGYRLVNDAPSFMQFSPPYGVPFRLDLMLVNDSTFSALSRDSNSVVCLGLPVHVPSALNLIAMKIHALRYGPESRKDKDWPDIKNLMKSAAIAPTSPELKAVFEKHGSAGQYAELLERCSHD